MKKTIKEKKAEISATLKVRRGNTSYYAISKLTDLGITQIKSIDKNKAYTIDTLLKVCEALGCKLIIK